MNIGSVAEQHDKIIITGSGPSIENFYKPEGWKVISVNNSVNHPKVEADYWFSLDPSRENMGIASSDINCKKYFALPVPIKEDPRITLKEIDLITQVNFLQRISNPNNKMMCTMGLQEDPSKISTGNSVYGALNLAYHMKPKFIIIIGLDGGYFRDKFDGTKCKGSLMHLDKLFSSTILQLKSKGIKIINANPRSYVTCFDMCPFHTAVNRFEKY